MTHTIVFHIPHYYLRDDITSLAETITVEISRHYLTSSSLPSVIKFTKSLKPCLDLILRFNRSLPPFDEITRRMSSFADLYLNLQKYFCIK